MPLQFIKANFLDHFIIIISSFKNERTAAVANTTRSTTTHGPKHAGINGRINAIPITTNAPANVPIEFQRRRYASTIESIRTTVEILIKSKNGWNWY